MRIYRPMLWRLSAGILAAVFLLLAAMPSFAADTGTYKISDYIVRLEPQSDGQVRITVSQQWQVLSGGIPWVTVGLPNNNFSIEKYGGAASGASKVNESGFQGVRIDLDKNYTAGQNFDIEFTVLQRNLLERLTEDKKWRISYTPGWYDRAVTGHLRVDFVSPIDYRSYSLVQPMPTSTNGNVITWETNNLPAGNRFHFTLESYDGGFLAENVPVGTSKSKGLPTSVYVIIGIILLVGLLSFWGIRQSRRAMDARVKQTALSIEEEMARDKKKRDEVEKGFDDYVERKDLKPDAQGRYYDRSYGDYITPAIYAAIIANQMNSTRNTGYRSGANSNCACACVSCACACACACAGGGAAGCSRKTLHDCRECQIRTQNSKIKSQNQN